MGEGKAALEPGMEHFSSPSRARSLVPELISNYEKEPCVLVYYIWPGKENPSLPSLSSSPLSFPTKMLPKIYLPACKYRVNSFNLIYRLL